MPRWKNPPVSLKTEVCTGGKIHQAYAKKAVHAQVEKSTSLYKVYHVFMGFCFFQCIETKPEKEGRKKETGKAGSKRVHEIP